MSNFIKVYLDGRTGQNVGLSTGLSSVNKAINGLQKAVMIAIAAAPKVGKSKFVDGHFILYPYILAPDADIEWIYFSYEMSRIQKEFAFASFFLSNDYDIHTYEWNNKTKTISADYLMGRLKDDNEKAIVVSDEIEAKLKLIYRNRIIPLFGEYSDKGVKLSKGKIDFIEQIGTVNDMCSYIKNYAKEHGTFVEEEYYTLDANGTKSKQKRVIGYEPKNPKKYTIIITDTVRQINRAKGQDLKQTVDEWIKQSAIIRNITGFSFIQIIHCNRNLATVERMKYMGEFLHPTAEDIKETGNLSEAADYIFTLFNPTDEKYGIRKHFGLELFDQQNNLLYPDYRSLHLVESRHTICPCHMQLELLGNIGCYKQLGT